MFPTHAATHADCVKKKSFVPTQFHCLGQNACWVTSNVGLEGIDTIAWAAGDEVVTAAGASDRPQPMAPANNVTASNKFRIACLLEK